VKPSTWNYRVVKKTTLTGGVTEEWYGIHEVYYNSDGTAEYCTEVPVTPIGETLEDLRADVAAYAAALNKPPVDYDSIGLLTPGEPVKN